MSIELMLAEHLAKKPKEPKRRTLVLQDATPEAIVHHLATNSRSAGLMSAEGNTANLSLTLCRPCSDEVLHGGSVLLISDLVGACEN